jgi:hypothetical protein
MGLTVICLCDLVNAACAAKVAKKDKMIMSKSLKRVIRALADANLDISPMELGPETRTAQQAADAAECHVDQIAKSVIFAGQTSGQAILSSRQAAIRWILIRPVLSRASRWAKLTPPSFVRKQVLRSVASPLSGISTRSGRSLIPD